MAGYHTPTDLLYSTTHEWARIEGDEVTVGISDYAQHALGDVVFVELPEVGRTLTAGEPLGVVESVKAASDVYAPLSGEVIAINEALLDAPETLNSDPYGAGWMLKLRASDLEAERSRLLDATAYERHVEDEASKH
ncbi:glycine cleavage system protein GcvH [Kallotenue papyrolyticum]|uniref:glycine cleavage system protein GcvH n=1 Tax=Kallotenue papyrolyticum TaxID=1325125 RepID=UPI000478536E|nr:glycine cleavage system protein GcvH [Kallotenue papyrolyticum]